jgi:hypothetical protein
LTATAGLTWAQLLKRPEVGIEAVLGALREELGRSASRCWRRWPPCWQEM